VKAMIAKQADIKSSRETASDESCGDIVVLLACFAHASGY
jgi:hypothetical protein